MHKREQGCCEVTGLGSSSQAVIQNIVTNKKKSKVTFACRGKVSICVCILSNNNNQSTFKIFFEQLQILESLNIQK